MKKTILVVLIVLLFAGISSAKVKKIEDLTPDEGDMVYSLLKKVYTDIFEKIQSYQIVTYHYLPQKDSWGGIDKKLAEPIRLLGVSVLDIDLVVKRKKMIERIKERACSLVVNDGSIEVSILKCVVNFCPGSGASDLSYERITVVPLLLDVKSTDSSFMGMIEEKQWI